MKREKILTIFMLVIMIATIILPVTVEATQTAEGEWTDFKNAKLEIVGEPTVTNQSIEDATNITYKIKVSNITLNPNSSYKVYFHQKDTEITKDKVLYHSHATIEKGKTEGTINLAEVFLQKNEDIYISVVEMNSANKTNLVETARKIDHPQIAQKLGNRFHIYFTSTSTSTYFWAPNCNEYGGDIDRTLNVKIGKVTNTELLKLIKTNKSEGLSKLLDYAKKTKEYNYIGKIEYKGATCTGTNVPTSEMNLVDGTYYFAYIQADDEKGIYYPVEDIALYRAKGTKDLVRHSDKEFVLDVEEPKQDGNSQQVSPTGDKKQEQPTGSKTQNPASQTKKDPTQAKGKIPQTGTQGIYIVGSFIIIVAAVVIYVKFREYRDIK